MSVVTQHSGRALHPQMTFFAPPPPEIGSVVSAYSSVRNNKVSPRVDWRLMLWNLFTILSVIWMGGAFLGVIFFQILESFFVAYPAYRIHGGDQGTFILSLLLAEALLLFPIKLIIDGCLEREYVCSYVGQQGIAEYRKSEDGELDEKVLLFANFKSLYKRFQEIYVKPYSNKSWYNYSGTQYRFFWCIQGEIANFSFPVDNQTPWFKQNRQKASGRLVSQQSIIGVFFSKAGRPRRNDPYYFAVAAERVWTSICLQRAQAELDQYGSAQFLIASGGLLEIQPGLLKVVYPTGTYQYDRNEIRLSAQNYSILIKNSINQTVGYESREMISIGRADPESPRKKLDVCTIDSSDIANLEAFLTLCETVVMPNLVN